MRDEDDGRIERHERLLQPLERLDVEVVRRLVEQQQVGIAGERASERRARELAAGERAELAVEVGSSSKPRPRTIAVARSRQVQPPACSRRASAREY